MTSALSPQEAEFRLCFWTFSRRHPHSVRCQSKREVSGVKRTQNFGRDSSIVSSRIVFSQRAAGRRNNGNFHYLFSVNFPNLHP
jgi:hypothetical protein